MVTTRRQSRGLNLKPPLPDEETLSTAPTSVAVSPVVPSRPPPTYSVSSLDGEDLARHSAAELRDNLYPKLKDIWTSGDPESYAFTAIIVYSHICVGNKAFCDDSVTEAYLIYLKRVSSKMPTCRLIEVLVAARGHLEVQRFSQVGMVRLLAICGDIICRESGPVIDVCVEIMLGIISVYPDDYEKVVWDTVAERLSDVQPEAIFKFLVGGCNLKHSSKDASKLVTRMHTLLLQVPDTYVGFVRYMTRPSIFLSIESTMQSLLAVQVIAYHLVNAGLTCADKNGPLTILTSLGEGLTNLLTHFETSAKDGPLLPCDIFALHCGSPKVKTCASCAEEGLQSPPPSARNSDKSLQKFGIFKCAFCDNLFSLDCNVCSSCPVSIDDRRICWGCGYRFIGSSVTRDHAGIHEIVSGLLDERSLCVFLVIASLRPIGAHSCTSWKSLTGGSLNKAFAIEALSRCVDDTVLVNKMTDMASSLRTKGEVSVSDLPFMPSSEFISELLGKLLLRDRLKTLRTNIVRTFFASAPSLPGLKGLSSVLTSDDSSTVRDNVLSILAGADFSNVKQVNGILSVIEKTGAEHLVEDLADLLFRHQLAISTKKHLFKLVLSCGKSERVIPALLTYLSVFESSSGDAETLFDQLVELQQRHWTESPAALCGFLADLDSSFLLSKRINRVATVEHCLRVIHDDSLSNESRYIGIEILTRNLVAQSDQVWMLLQPVIRLFLRAEDRRSTFLGLQSLTNILGRIGDDQLNMLRPQLHELMNSSLLPSLVTENSETVHIACLAVTRIAKPGFVEGLLEKFAAAFVDTDDAAARIRAAWIVASLAQNHMKPIAQTLIDSLVAFATSTQVGSGVTLLGFLGRNQFLRENLIARPEFTLLMRNALGGPSHTGICTRALEALIGIMESVSTSSMADLESSTNRPDGGVCCRALSVLYPWVVQGPLFVTDPRLPTLALRCVELMDLLGIVNRRLLPPLLLARYVVSAREPDPEFPDDTMEANTYAYWIFSKVLDNKIQLIPNLFAEIERTLHGSLPSSTVCAVHRFTRFLSQGRREDLRVVSQVCLERLTQKSSEDGFTFFITCCLIFVCRALSEDKLTDALIARSSDDATHEPDRSFPFRFVLTEVSADGAPPDERLQHISELAQRFTSRTIPDTCKGQFPSVALITNKRRRSSVGPLQKSRNSTKKRKTLAQLAEGESDDEYTDGGVSPESDGC